MNSKYKKIGEVEMIIGLVFLFGLYIMNDLLDGLVIGLFIVPVINLFCLGINWWFFDSRGDKKAGDPQSIILQFITGAIPLVPAPIITFIVKTYIHNHPKVSLDLGKNVVIATPKA